MGTQSSQGNLGSDDNREDEGGVDAPVVAGTHSSHDRQAEFLIELCTNHINETGKHSHHLWRRVHTIRFLSIGFGMLITIFLGLKNFTTEAQLVLSNLALVLGAIITALGAWENYAGYSRLWINTSSTVKKLDAIRREISFMKCGGLGGTSQKNVEEIYKRINTVLMERDEAWREISDPERVRSHSFAPGANRSVPPSDSHRT